MAEKKTATFVYEKSPQFRVIHVDGAWGGYGPRNTFNLMVFNERRSDVHSTTHEIGDDGGLGVEVDERREMDRSFLRQLECNLVFDLQTARSLRNWLDEHIQKAEAIRASKEGWEQ